MRTLGILIAALSLTACLDPGEQEPATTTTAQAISSDCTLSVNLTGRSTAYRYTVPTEFYDYYDCGAVQVNVTTGSHKWKPTVTWDGFNLDYGDATTCQHAQLVANTYHGSGLTPYTSGSDLGVWDYSEGHHDNGGNLVRSCVEPQVITGSFNAGVAYAIRAEAQITLDGYHNGFHIDFAPL